METIDSKTAAVPALHPQLSTERISLSCNDVQRIEFLKNIVANLRNSPVLFSDVLVILSEIQTEMQAAEKNRRDSHYRSGTASLVDMIWSVKIKDKKNPQLFSHTEYCELLDALSALYPNGDAKGSSIAHKSVMNHFCVSMKELGWTPDGWFVKEIRQKSEFFFWTLCKL